MRKLIFGLASSVLIVALPLIFKIDLIINYKILIIIAGTCSVWLTQPTFTKTETLNNKESDEFSVLLIIGMSFLSVMVPIIDWAYFKTDHYTFSFFTVLGTILIIAGLILRAWAVQTLGKFFTATVTIQDEHVLVTNGPYNLVRHPSYSGAFITISAGSILLESIIGFVFAVAFLGFAYYKRIRIEEKELTKYFGESYKRYTKKTKRLIPFLF